MCVYVSVYDILGVLKYVRLVCVATCLGFAVADSRSVHINRMVVEMGSTLLLHITHAIIPLASQCASAVIRWKQTLLLAAVCARERAKMQAHIFNIYFTCVRVFRID